MANHGQAVAEVASQTEVSAKTTTANTLDATNNLVQDGKDAAQDQGKEVKKVAKAKRQGKPGKVEAEAGTEVEGAGRVVTAGRPQKVAGAGRVKGGAARPVRVLNPSAAGRSVGVGAGATGKGIGVGAKTKIKIRN